MTGEAEGGTGDDARPPSRPPVADELSDGVDGAHPDAGAEPHRSLNLPDLRKLAAAPATVILPALVFIGAILAALDDAAPTGLDRADAAWRALAGGLIVACAAFAPPMAWVLAAAGAAASSGQTALITMGAITIVVAAVAALRFPDNEWVGGVVGVGVSWVIFRLPHDTVIGLSTLVAAAILVPIVVGAWYWGPDWLIRVFTWSVAVIGVAAILGVLVLGFTMFSARGKVNNALDLADDAVVSFRDGDEQEARELLAQAVDELAAASDETSAPWVRATRLIPVLGQHTDALDTVIESGRSSADAALDVLAEIDRGNLAIIDGRVPVAAIENIEPRIVALADATERARSDIAAARLRWLLPPMRSALDRADDELDDVTRSSRRAADAARLTPSMLGADEPRNHLVILVTPAELRGSGGLIGNWALIQASGGSLELLDVGRAIDVNNLLVGQAFELTQPAQYVERYDGNQVETEFWDATLSPNYPDVASVVAQLFEAATGTPVDSVMLVDPDGVAALMELTGPVEMGNRTMTASNIRQFLLFDQYADFDTDEQRIAFLELLLTRTFTQLLTIDFSDPWDLDEVFETVVDEDRLMLVSLRSDEQRLLTDLGLDGSFPTVAEGAADLIGVVTQNGGQNKADAFLERSIDYDATINPVSGRIDATVTVELTNTLTDLSLPGPIVGSNDQGLPAGTNLSAVTVYTPHQLLTAALDGEEVGLQGIREFGLLSYTRVIEIPAGETVVLELELRGDLDLSEAYRLVVPVQPTANPDLIRLRVSSPSGVLLDGSRASWQHTVRTSSDQEFQLQIAAAG